MSFLRERNQKLAIFESLAVKCIFIYLQQPNRINSPKAELIIYLSNALEGHGNTFMHLLEKIMIVLTLLVMISRCTYLHIVIKICTRTRIRICEIRKRKTYLHPNTILHESRLYSIDQKTSIGKKGTL